MSAGRSRGDEDGAVVTALAARLRERHDGRHDPPDEEELAAVAAVAASSDDPDLHALAAAERAGELTWEDVWADPVSRGQAGLDLVAAVMDRAAWLP